MKDTSSLHLNKQRTFLANERTLLAYFRTAFAALILGFGLIQFSGNHFYLVIVGSIAIILGIIFAIIGPLKYAKRNYILNNSS